MKVLILTRYGRLGASSRLRFLQFLPWFEQAGLEYTVSSFFDDIQLCTRYENGGYLKLDLLQAFWRRTRILMRRTGFDMVWIEKEAIPWSPAWFERRLLRDTPYVLDYDDAIFHNYDLHSSALVRRLLGHRIDRLIKGAPLVVAGNSYLAERAYEAGAPKVEIIPTVIDLSKYSLKPVLGSVDDPLRIVWIGSPSTIRYLAMLREPLATLSQRFTYKFRVIGRDPVDMPRVELEFMPWDEATEVDLIETCDIGVMPLLDSPWERGKCGYKLIQYMACGLPVVASPVGVNTGIVSAGENGFLANSSSQWVDCLSTLLDDVSLRQQMGKSGRKRVEEEYCSLEIAPRLVALLQSVALKH